MTRHTDPKPEFSRLVAAPKSGAKVAIDESADPAERAALARRFGTPSVDQFRVTATLRAVPGGAMLTGTVAARLTQQCVVTMEPVETRLEEPLDRRFAPANQIESEGAFDPEAEDPPDPLTDEIDVGEIAAETAALAIDPYPRAAGAKVERNSATPPGSAPLDDDAVKPFASLADLKKRLEGETDGDA